MNLTEDQIAERFWNWCNKNQNKFLFLSHLTELIKCKLMPDFLAELLQFSEDIYFEIGGHPDNDNVELIISEEEIPNHFRAVEKKP